MRQYDIISKALMFAGFLINKGLKIDSLILFGSVARGDFDKESDIDIFVETIENDKKVLSVLNLFNNSKINQEFIVKGITNDIVLKIGKLDKWKNLKDSIISDGITLYGKYQNLPDSFQQKIIFRISPDKLARKAQVSVWRQLYGYTQIANKKAYGYKGMIGNYNGEKIANSVFIVPAKHRNIFIKLFKERRIGYQIYECWTK